MFLNLQAEMARKKIHVSDLMKYLGYSYKQVHQRLKGEVLFNVKEMYIIRNTLFNGLTLDYLFEMEE